MRKKILYITNDSWWDTDINIFNDLKEEFDVNVFVTSVRNKEKNKYPIKSVPKSITLHNECYSTTKWNPLMLINSIIYLFKLLPFIKNRYVFYVIDNNPYLNFILPFLLPSRRTILSYHNYVPHGDSRFWERAISNLYLKKFLYFHFQSDLQESYFKKDYPEKKSFSTKMAVKDFGLPKNIVNIKKDNRRVFLFFGSIREYKKLDSFIKAANRIDENKAYFVIAGFCNDKEKYEKLIANKENFNVNFSFIENDCIPDYFSQADFLVLPYSDTTQSGPLLIAYNYNLPIIASDLEYFKQMIKNGENGYLFKQNCIDDLIKCFNRAIMLNENDYKKMKDNMSICSNKYKDTESFSKELSGFISHNL